MKNIKHAKHILIKFMINGTIRDFYKHKIKPIITKL